MKIYLDDTRHPTQSFELFKNEIYLKNDWTICIDYNSFVNLLNKIVENNQFSEITLISFDHDLADEHYNRVMLHSDHSLYNELYDTFQEKTGLDCAKYLIEICLDNNFKLPDYLVHTQNPVGHVNISSLLDNFRKFQD